METLSYAALHYNQVRAKASHNSYQRTEGLSDQFAYWRLRSLELDLHNSNIGAGWPTLNGDWYVYHVSVVDQSSSVRTLKDALAVLAAFNAAVPEHEVCTIALDIKDSFDSTHTPEQLDGLINSALPGRVYTPADLLGSNSNLQQSANNWPLLSELRGKFVFILTTGNLDSPDSHLNQYVDNGASANIRTCFVAPEISSVGQISAKDYAVWFNMTVSNAVKLGPAVFQAGFMSRAYGANSANGWNQAIAAQNHLIGTDEVNALRSPWARTDNSLGWPFQGIDVAITPEPVEAGTVVGLNVSSDDIWGKADSCAMALFPAAGDQIYTYAVAIPASHAPDEWGKAGLMVRASTAADAANFCILRPAEGNKIRVQVRARNGASTDRWDLVPPPNNGVRPDTWMYLRLQVRGHTVQAWASSDALNWTSVHTHTFDSDINLPVRGIVGSARHSDLTIRYLYFPLADSALPAVQAQAIGQNVNALAYAGIYPPG